MTMILQKRVFMVTALWRVVVSLSSQGRRQRHRVRSIAGESIRPLSEGAAPMWQYDGMPEAKEWTMVIDVRSPKEFREDHVPGAVNLPVLDDEERAVVGTLYAQNCPFEARKLGARLVARNIAEILDEGSPVCRLERDARILVYCWRGGERSNALAVALSRVGWHTARLAGGYKSYRRRVRTLLHHSEEDASSFYDSFDFVRIEGSTGTGKGLLLDALEEEGFPTLDLEEIANHRGSALGGLVSIDHNGDVALDPQPTQKMFETNLARSLRPFAAATATTKGTKTKVAVESESAKIGALNLPSPLHSAIVRAPVAYALDVPLAARVEHIRRTYAVFETPAGSGDLKRRLTRLAKNKPKQILARWVDLIDQDQWDDLVTDLLVHHYDPAYADASKRDQNREKNRQKRREEVPATTTTRTLHLRDLTPDTVRGAARELARNELQ